MNSRNSAAAGFLAVTAVLSAHAEGPSSPGVPATRPAGARVDLASASTNASRMGYAHLVFRPEGTDVEVQVPLANNMTVPVHLYTSVHQGTCSSLGPSATKTNGRVIGYRERSGLWSVRNTIPLTLDALRASPHALAVRSGPADGNELLYCGDLRLG